MLPKRFTRGQAIDMAKNFNIAERTVGTLLKNCLGSHLIQPEYGVYEKLIKQPQPVPHRSGFIF